MKTILIVLLSMFMNTIVVSQTIEKFSIDSGGASILTEGIQILSTIGEVNVAEYTLTNVSVSEGFINEAVLSSTLGVNTVEVVALEMNIYPNPASDIIHVNTDIKLTKIEIYDVLGKRVLESSDVSKINVRHFKSGVYILKIYAEDNQFTSKRIVIN